MTSVLFIPAFVAGVLTFLAPCTLPLVPAYLAFISGVTPKEFASISDSAVLRRRVFLNGVLYVLGFSVVFVLLGVLFGLGGAALIQYRLILNQVGGVLIILFGLFLLGLSQVRWLQFLNTEKRFHIVHVLHPGKPLSSFLFGAIFSLGWTPCIGPILGSILLLASSSATVLQGAVLLAVFSVGLALPFLLLAASIGSALHSVEMLRRLLPWISKIGGVFLIIVGLLLLFHRQALLFVPVYSFFEMIGLGSLEKFY